MSHIKELDTLLKEDVLIEVNQNIQEIETALKEKPKNKSLKEELNYMKEVKKYFDEVVEDIKLGNITEDEAVDILEGLEDMKAENQDI